MASTKAGGSTKNLRDSNPKYLGVKLADGASARPGMVIVRQRGTKIMAGKNVRVGKDRLLGETEGKLLCAAFVRRVSSGVRARECVCWGLRAHSIRASPTARRRTVARPLTPTHCSAGFFARGVRGHARAPREDTGAVVGCHCRRRRRRGGGRHVRAQRRRGCGCTLAWRLYAGT